MRHKHRATTPCIIKLIYQPAPYFGIDLGTTFSCIAYQYPDTRQTKIIIADTSAKRQYCIPTAVYFPPKKKDKLLFGYEARHKLATDPENVIFDIKRIIGRKFNDPEVALFANNHQFKITTEHDSIQIIIPNRNIMISPEQALGVILKHLVQMAVKEVNIVTDEAINVVISIPAFFHNGQRRAVISAARLAHLDAKILIIEPTAAAIAHMQRSTLPKDDYKLFLVFDYGGGTLDCSVMRCAGLECNVLAVAGNSTLGGIDFDYVIKDIIETKMKDTYGINREEMDEAQLLEDSERIKIGLSVNEQYSYKYKDKPEIIIKRTEFEKHTQTEKLLKAAMKTAKDAITPDTDHPQFVASNVRMLLMIGGSSKIPLVKKKLRKAFTRTNLKLEFPELDPQLMVITGSAVLAGSMIYDKKVPVTDVIPLSLGFDVWRGGTGGHMDIIVPKNTHYPLEVNKTYCQIIINGKTRTSDVLDLYEGEDAKVEHNHFISSLSVKTLIPRETCNTGTVGGGTLHAVFRVDANGIITIHGVAHKKDGSDGNVYTMSLSLKTEDGSISKTEVNRMKNDLESWFFIIKTAQKSKRRSGSPAKKPWYMFFKQEL
eukprot:264411_1